MIMRYRLIYSDVYLYLKVVAGGSFILMYICIRRLSKKYVSVLVFYSDVYLLVWLVIEGCPNYYLRIGVESSAKEPIIKTYCSTSSVVCLVYAGSCSSDHILMNLLI
jgi:hypothetical protein